MSDPFEVLGVRRDASLDDVRAARRRLAKTLHPDHGGDADAMRRLNGAFDAAVKSLRQPVRVPAAAAPPPSAGPAPSEPPMPPTRARRQVEYDAPSFTVDVLPVDAFEALFVVAGWIGEVLVDDPPYLLDVHLHEPASCWCRLELLPEAGGTTVSITVASVGREPAPPVEEVRDLWVAQLNAL